MNYEEAMKKAYDEVCLLSYSPVGECLSDQVESGAGPGSNDASRLLSCLLSCSALYVDLLTGQSHS